MRRSAAPLVIGFAAGVFCLAVFMAATGRLSMPGTHVAPTQPAPSLTPDLTNGPARPTNAASPEPPDPATFTPPVSERPLPSLGDPLHSSSPGSIAPGPTPPDPGNFKPGAQRVPQARTQPVPQPAPQAASTDASKAFTPPPVTDADTQALKSRGLVLPIAGLKTANILDTFNDARGTGRKHEATDILSPRGTPVLAMDEGNVARLFTSKLGGLTVYQFDNQKIYCFYYAHLDRYAEGLKEGMLLRKGDKVGYVGSTGDANANTPHLHLAIFKMGPEKRWWQGAPINPYPILMHIVGK